MSRAPASTSASATSAARSTPRTRSTSTTPACRAARCRGPAAPHRPDHRARRAATRVCTTGSRTAARPGHRTARIVVLAAGSLGSTRAPAALPRRRRRSPTSAIARQRLEQQRRFPDAGLHKARRRIPPAARRSPRDRLPRRHRGRASFSSRTAGSPTSRARMSHAPTRLSGSAANGSCTAASRRHRVGAVRTGDAVVRAGTRRRRRPAGASQALVGRVRTAAPRARLGRTASQPTIDAVASLHRRLAFLTGGPLSPVTWTAGRDLVTPHPLGGCNMGTTARQRRQPQGRGVDRPACMSPTADRPERRSGKPVTDDRRAGRAERRDPHRGGTLMAGQRGAGARPPGHALTAGRSNPRRWRDEGRLPGRRPPSAARRGRAPVRPRRRDERRLPQPGDGPVRSERDPDRRQLADDRPVRADLAPAVVEVPDGLAAAVDADLRSPDAPASGLGRRFREDPPQPDRGLLQRLQLHRQGLRDALRGGPDARPVQGLFRAADLVPRSRDRRQDLHRWRLLEGREPDRGSPARR